MATPQMTPEGWRYDLDPTRHHRERNWDYRGRGIYHITLAVAERYPLFGRLEGNRAEQAHIELNEFGEQVWQILSGLSQFYAPKGYAIKILAAQIMPDHIHVVIQVLEPLPNSIGHVVRGFKTACTMEYKQRYITDCMSRQSIGCERASGDKNIAEMQNTISSHGTGSAKDITISSHGSSSLHNILHFVRIFANTGDSGSIWQPDIARYHDRILHSHDQLQPMIDYVKDNPRRLWLKRANPDLFRIRRQTMVAGIECTTLGNIFLAERPMRTVLQCSRKLTQAEIDAKREDCLAKADNGTVFICAAISEGEKQISRALRRAGYPMIILLNNGFPKPGDPHERYYKPGGEYFNACANGQLLLIEPSQALIESPEVEASVYRKAHDVPHSSPRYRFLALNAIGWMIET